MSGRLLGLTSTISRGQKAQWYSAACLKRPLKNRQNKCLKNKWQLSAGQSIAECSAGVRCNTFDLHLAINGLKT